MTTLSRARNPRALVVGALGALAAAVVAFLVLQSGFWEWFHRFRLRHDAGYLRAAVLSEEGTALHLGPARASG